jgi:hypothetical protein
LPLGGDGESPRNNWLVNCAARLLAYIDEAAVFAWFEFHLSRYCTDVGIVPSCGDGNAIAEEHADIIALGE